jgi:hypothetical protein
VLRFRSVAPRPRVVLAVPGGLIGIRPCVWLFVAAVCGAPAVFAQTDAQAAPEAALPAESAGPRLTLRGFTNIDFAVNEDRLPQTFSLGQFDLFVTSALSENWSFLAEVNFEFGDDNALAVDVERAQLRYAPWDAFTISAGRMHTPLGYWNQTFHHGSWFQTTAGRPEMYLFEDEGGILPVHEVGVQAAGTLHGRAIAFKYRVGVVNGRGRIPDEVTNLQDRNDGKAVSVLLALAPVAVKGLEVGVDAYLDRIPADPDVPGREGEIRERILGAYLTLLRSDTELLAEVSHVHHRDEVSGGEFDTWGLYAQGSRKIGHWRPYYRFDKVDVADGDPFLSPKDLSRHTVGLRFDPMPWVGLKGEYHLTRLRGEDQAHSARFQAAFTF